MRAGREPAAVVARGARLSSVDEARSAAGRKLDPGIRWTEKRDKRGPDGRGEVQQARIVCNHSRRLFHHAGRLAKTKAAGQVQDAPVHAGDPPRDRRVARPPENDHSLPFS